MNEDIKQLIEKEAREEYLEYLHGTSNEEEFLDMDDVIPLHDAVKACEITANFILSKWQEADRWRKVEEELPKDGALVLAKWEALDPEHTEIKVLSYSVELGFITADELGDCDDNVTHWKPIND